MTTIIGGGIDPKYWGPSGWKILHRLSFMFSDIEEAHNFFISLEYLLPCPKCRYNYNRHISSVKFPVDLRDIPLWVYKIHNKINKTRSPSYSNIVKYWDAIDKTKVDDNEWIFIEALAENFPKNNKNNYIKNLRIFLETWGKYSKKPITYDIFHSKTSFKKWITDNASLHVKLKITDCNNYLCSMK